MKCGGRTTRDGFTLTELIAVMTVLGALAGVVAPLAWSASDAFHHATEARGAMERCDFALVRMAQLFRESPAAPGGGAGITTARPNRVVFQDGARIELIGTTLWMAASDGVAAPLCQSVDEFEINYRAADGVTDASAAPAQTHSVALRIRSGKFELRTVVFLAQARVDS